MKLTWYGTASLVLEEKGRAVAFDPFCGIAPGELKTPPEVLPDREVLGQVKRVFVTHGHFDHIYHLPRLYAGTDTEIYCTHAPVQTLTDRGMDAGQLTEIGPGWTESFDGLSVKALAGRHCRFDLPVLLSAAGRSFRHPGHVARLLRLHLSCREKGETLFYEVTGETGRVQILGSMALAGTVDYPTGADAMVLPLQGRSDQDTYALALVERLKPQRVYLDHYDNTFPPMTGEIDPEGFVRNVEEKFHIPCIPLEKGKTIAL